MTHCPACGASFSGRRCGTCGYEMEGSSASPESSPDIPSAARVADPAYNGATNEEDEETSEALPQKGEAVKGIVASCDGPRPLQPATDYWKMGTVLIWSLLLLPVLVTIKIISLIIGIAFSLVFRRPFFGSGERSWLDEILFFRLTEVLFRKKEPIPCYIVKLQTPAGPVIARQEGEFDTTYPMVGHEVELQGVWRNGVLIIMSGFDHTTGVLFSRPRTYYKIFFFISLLILVAAVVTLSAWGNRLQ